MRLQLAAAALLAASSVVPTSALADTRDKTGFTLGHRVLAPAGYRAYCQADESGCGATAATPAPAPVVVQADVGDVWRSAFAQVRAERAFPTGSVTPIRVGGVDWRLRVRPQVIAPVESAPKPVAAPVSAEPERLTLTSRSRRMLQTVNQDVNGRIRPERDEDVGDGRDVWGARLDADGRLYGDCEDYVLAKREALLEAGVPASALSIAVGRNRQGGSHAVLVVATDQGELVMDNLSYWVRPMARSPYRWVMMQAYGEPNNWRAVTTADNAGPAPRRAVRVARR